MQKKELDKLQDNLAESVGIIGIMVYMEDVTLDKAHILVDGMMLLAIKEHSMNEKFAFRIAETLHKELESCVKELEEL